MKAIKETSPEDFFLFTAEETPSYMLTIEEHKNTLQAVESEVFEPL